MKLGLKDGLEIHILCLTVGVDIWPPAIETPFGRLGFPERSVSGDKATE